MRNYYKEGIAMTCDECSEKPKSKKLYKDRYNHLWCPECWPYYAGIKYCPRCGLQLDNPYPKMPLVYKCRVCKENFTIKPRRILGCPSRGQ
jgi:predicted amidophosphoribosyltransferase